jgi:glutamine synthetase
LVNKADQVQILKYVLMNVAHSYGKTATFMPKPLVEDNGNGAHVHQSLAKGGDNIFTGDGYGGLSETALYYIGGILKHAKAINAFTNAATNSYKRLVPGFEAPTLLAYSAKNRSAAVRIPFVANPQARRVEVRFPDSSGNPYFAFAAMLMAGLDGIQNKIDPGAPMDTDREFLLAGDVFSNDLIDGYVELKMEEITRLRMSTHPVEFDMYYSL